MVNNNNNRFSLSRRWQTEEEKEDDAPYVPSKLLVSMWPCLVMPMWYSIEI